MAKKCRLVVNRHAVAKNKKHGTDDPVISIRTYNSTEYAKRIRLLGNGWILEQNFENPLCSGATVYLVGRRDKLEILE